MSKRLITYRQSREVSWLPTKEGTIWYETGIDSYIQPLSTDLQTTALGVDLDLLDNFDDGDLFIPIQDDLLPI
jgi:hypothetical protein